jgi:hypothetical protein
MQQKHNRIRLNRHITNTLIFLAVAAASVVVVAKHNNRTTDAAPVVKQAVGAAVPSEFKFTGASGWWQGATNKTSMALFPNAQDCFTSVEYKAGTVDAAAELQKTQATLTSSGYIVTPSSTQTLALQTAKGPQKYQLYQSTVTTPTGASTVEGGQEFGYLQPSSGYLKIMGYCDTTAELPTTIPALQAMKFDGAM